jgi:hypothetical protein
MSEVFRIQPYNLSPSTWTTNSPTAYAILPPGIKLSSQQREVVEGKVAAINGIASCNWDDEGRLLLVRQPDLIWGAQEGVGQKVCEVVSAELNMSLQFEMGTVK